MRNKIKRNNEIHFLCTEKERRKLELLCGEEYTIAEKLRYYINTNFKNTFQTNDVEVILSQKNREVLNELQKQKKIKEKQENLDRESLEEAKAAFIARRNAKKEGITIDQRVSN